MGGAVSGGVFLRCPGSFKAATTDASQIREWWHKWPAMIGLPTGPASGIDVLDIDLKPEEGIDGYKHVPIVHPALSQCQGRGNARHRALGSRVGLREGPRIDLVITD